MQLLGLELSAFAVATLALLLQRRGHHALANRVGWAVDTGRDSLGLSSNEADTILSSLDDPPPSLAALRAVLLDEHREQGAS